MDPNLGSRPSSPHENFYFQRIPEKHFMGLIFIVVWVLGLCWGSIFFFFNYSMAAFLHLLPTIAEHIWMDLSFTFLSRWQVKSCDIVFPSHADHTVKGGLQNTQLFFLSLPLFKTKELCPDLVWCLKMHLPKKKTVWGINCTANWCF